MCVCKCTGAHVCLRACSRTNPARNAPPYCHLRPLWLHHIFRHYLTNGMIFGKALLNIKCVLIFSTTFMWNISHYTKNSVTFCHKCENVFKYAVFLSDFNTTWISLIDVRKKAQTSSFIRIRPMGAELFHAEGRTDIKKLTVIFAILWTRPKVTRTTQA